MAEGRHRRLAAGRAWLAACGLLALHGCGLQLRDSAPWPAALARLQLGGPELRADFERVLRPELRAGGAMLVAAGDPNAARLEVVAFDQRRQLLAVAVGSGRREYQLSVTVAYRVVTATGDAGEARRITARRDYLLHPDDLAGALAEERRLREALLADAAGTLVRQLSHR